ncbi:MAG TPA: hypothetical protein VKU19_13190 [Bryobacteraceae bacterium]|nr:hypothetical protein [Bryobacteraceae bacterium]
MLLRCVVLGCFLCSAMATAQDEVAARAKLAGKWQPKAGEKSDYGNWTLEEHDGSIRVTQEANGQKITEYVCNTMGQECKIKEGGRTATVSMWFNGSKLVEMRTRGTEVVKRRFEVAGDGDVLDLEVIPIAPAGKPEVIHMSRLRGETDRKAQ